MKTITFLMSLFLIGCTSTPTTSVGGGVAVTMSSKDYSRMKQVEADAIATSEYYKAQADIYKAVTDPTAQVALMMKEALGGDTAPTNSNDVALAETEASVRKHETWAGAIKTTLGLGVAYKGIDTLASLGKAAINKSSVEINADNGASVEGAIGEGNSYTTTEGILTEPAEVNSLSLGVEPEDVVCEIRVALEGEELIDANDDGLVCSDGEGGAFDNE